MATVYCTQCWAVQPSGAVTCRRCGAEVAAVPEVDYVTKLIRALDHPEPETPARAAMILGELRAERAVGPLGHVLLERSEPGLLEAAATALGRIGHAESVPALLHVLQHPSYLTVRLRAIGALAAIGGAEAERALKWVAENDASMGVREEARAALSAWMPDSRLAAS